MAVGGCARGADGLDARFGTVAQRAIRGDGENSAGLASHATSRQGIVTLEAMP